MVETVRVELPVPPDERETGLTEKAVVGPMGETAAERVTLPEKLLRLLRLMVEVPEEPACNVRDVGFAEIEKSGLPPLMLQLSVKVPLVRIN